jgi:hypothetical protein
MFPPNFRHIHIVVFPPNSTPHLLAKFRFFPPKFLPYSATTYGQTAITIAIDVASPRFTPSPSLPPTSLRYLVGIGLLRRRGLLNQPKPTTDALLNNSLYHADDNSGWGGSK